MNQKKISFFIVFLSIFGYSCNRSPFIDFKVSLVDSTVTIVPIYLNTDRIDWEVEGLKTISTLDTFSFVIPIRKIGEKNSYSYYQSGSIANQWFKSLTIKATASGKGGTRSISRECVMNVNILRPVRQFQYVFNSIDGSNTINESVFDTSAIITKTSNSISIKSGNSVFELDSIPMKFGNHVVRAKILFANKTWISNVCSGEVRVIVSSSDKYSLSGTFEGTLFNAADCNDVGLSTSGDFFIVY